MRKTRNQTPLLLTDAPPPLHPLSELVDPSAMTRNSYELQRVHQRKTPAISIATVISTFAALCHHSPVAALICYFAHCNKILPAPFSASVLGVERVSGHAPVRKYLVGSIPRSSEAQSRLSECGSDHRHDTCPSQDSPVFH